MNKLVSLDLTIDSPFKWEYGAVIDLNARVETENIEYLRREIKSVSKYFKDLCTSYGKIASFLKHINVLNAGRAVEVYFPLHQQGTTRSYVIGACITEQVSLPGKEEIYITCEMFSTDDKKSAEFAVDYVHNNVRTFLKRTLDVSCGSNETL